MTRAADRRPHRRSRIPPAARAGLAAAAILLAALASHAPLLRAGYVQDDHLAVEENAAVARGDLHSIFSASYWEGARGDDRTLYRPITVLTFALERKATGTPSPLLSHLVNVLLHALASIALAALARRIGVSGIAAAAAGLLFALHPVLTEAVANVVGRSEILAALFTLGALLAQTATGPWAPPGARPAFPGGATRQVAAWLSAALVFLALGSKETAIAAVGLLLAVELLFRPPSRTGALAWIVDRGAALAPAALAVLLHGILRIRALESFLLPQAIPPMDNPLVRLEGAERLATALAIAARYARLLLLPVRLSADYSGDVIEAEPGLWAPLPLAGVVFLGACAAVALLPALIALRRRRTAAARGAPPVVRQASLSAALFLLPYLVIGNLLFRIGAGMAERFLYLPSAGYCLLLAVVLGRIIEGDIAFVPATRAELRRLAALSLALVMAGFAITTAARCLDWRNDRSVFEAAARVQPRSPRAHFIVATLDGREGKPAEALRGFDLVLRLWPDHLPAWVEKATILGQQGDFAGAEAAAREAIRIGPAYGRAHSNLGLALHRLGRLPEAERSLRRAVLWDPRLDLAWAELGNVLFEQGRYGRAAAAYSRALALGRTAVRARLEEARRLTGA